MTLIPEGIVVFFSSFDYEALVYNSWKESGILARIMKKKRIYREPRKSTEVKLVLKEYNDTIEELSHSDPKSHNGAILLAIVGGKISEGINFSDGMGRCIIMVGLPYPSPSDIELIERVKHIESIGCASISKTPKLSAPTQCFNGDAQAGLNILRSCKHRGKQYYENLCIKALNQSIGKCYDQLVLEFLIIFFYCKKHPSLNQHHRYCGHLAFNTSIFLVIPQLTPL